MNGKHLQVESWMIFPSEDQQRLRDDYVRIYTANSIFEYYGGLRPLQDFVENPNPPAMMGSKGLFVQPMMASKGERRLPEGVSKKLEVALNGVKNIESAVLQPTLESLGTAIVRGSIEGLLSGYCVVLANALREREYKTKAGNRAHASMNVATYVCEQMLSPDTRKRPGRPKKSGEVRPPANAQQLKVLLRHYRAVAPLWAAYLHLQEHPQLSPKEPGFLDGVSLLAMQALVPHYEQIVTATSSPKVRAVPPADIALLFSGHGKSPESEAPWWHKQLDDHAQTYFKYGS